LAFAHRHHEFIPATHDRMFTMSSATHPLGAYHQFLETLPLSSRLRAPAADEVALPVPLLAQLARPINSLDDVQLLMAELQDARARGCF
jgi:hypothetical protein